MPKVSVIIPVYGVEKYIERCARSLFEQTLNDIEYIFVDDCSPDKSIEILEHIVEEYRPRFTREKKVVRIERLLTNSGLAAVRKQGIQFSTGEYVIHCDSDDWVHPEMYERLYNYAVTGDYDMVWCDYYRSDGKHNEYIHQESDTQAVNLVGNMLAGSRSRLIGSVCNRLYKRRLQTSIIYPKANMNEDLVIVTQLTLACKKIGHLSQALYYYYVNPASICMEPNEKSVVRNLEGAIDNNRIIMQVLSENGLDKCLSKQIVSKKLACKEILIPLLGQRKYRDLWRDTFSEINSQIMSNPYISRNSKFRAFCMLYWCYPLYSFIKNMSVFIHKIK